MKPRKLFKKIYPKNKLNDVYIDTEGEKNLAEFNPDKTNLNFFLKSGLEKIERIWKKLGPGLVTGASDDDPSGIATYTQAGAKFGFNTLWTTWITFPLMLSIQEMCGRIGLVTNHGIAGVIKKNYSKNLLYFVAFITIPACILNIGANLAAMGAVANLIFPDVSNWVFTIGATILVIYFTVFLSYKKLEATLKWLTLVLLVYLLVPFLAEVNFGEVIISTFSPKIEFTKEYIAIIVAILGTTISPYLFFWEASMEVEDHQQGTTSNDISKVDTSDIKQMQKDNFVGMFFSNFVMFFIILTGGAVLHKNGLTEVTNVKEAAEALRPIAGDFAYLLFTFGVIGTGLLSIPVLAGACSYVLSETFGWEQGMNRKFKEAKGFYVTLIAAVVIGLMLNFAKIDPVQALILTAIIYGVVSPILIYVILKITNSKKIMGEYTNSKLSNFFGIACLVIMSVAALALLITSF